MPLYEYRCESCEHQFEVIQKFSDAPIAVCPQCGGGPVVKLLSSPAFQFKGSGWYITDYARKESGKSAGSSDSGASEKSGDAKESKPAADTSSASTPAPASTGTKTD
jgi:putative FmdB family regulatory protein